MEHDGVEGWWWLSALLSAILACLLEGEMQWKCFGGVTEANNNPHPLQSLCCRYLLQKIVGEVRGDSGQVMHLLDQGCMRKSMLCFGIPSLLPASKYLKKSESGNGAKGCQVSFKVARHIALFAAWL